MTKRYNYINLCFSYFWITLLIISLTSCLKDDLDVTENVSDDFIRIRASVYPSENTRAESTFYGSDEIEDVNSGMLYLTYPKEGNQSSSSAIYGTSYVDFDASYEDEYVGFAYFIDSDDEKKDLKWKHIWNEGKTSKTLYLHNINPEYYTEAYTGSSRTQNYQKMTFKSTSPFMSIQPLDKEHGSNDIITGSISATNSTNNITFSLWHRLSLLKLNIEVYASKSDNWPVNLDNAQVFLNNLYTKLESYNISYPTQFSTSSSYQYGKYSTRATDSSPIVLKGTGEKDPQWQCKNIGTYDAEDGETYKKIEYQSLEFVVPPQALVSGYRPKFTVRVPKEDVTGSETDKGKFIDYTGYLPELMFNVVKGEIDPTPINTAFTSGYQLTVTASINSPETELYFAPVKVESWVSCGTFTVNTNQAGIYNIKDFQDMVKAYRKGDLTELEQYGYFSNDGSIILQFWNNVSLPEFLFEETKNGETIPVMLEGCMKKDDQNPIDFTFLFNDNVISVPDDLKGSKDLEDSSGQIELYGIVTGEKESYTGVNSSEDFKKVLELLSDESNPQIHKLLKYGSISNINNSLVIDIKSSFDINIEEIYQKIPKTFAGYNISLQFPEDININLILSEKDNVKINFNIYNIDLFNRILFISTTYGIYNTEDFLLLKKFYNQYCKYYPDLLSLFGVKSSDGSSWTLYLRAAFTIDGDDFFYSMIPDPSNGKPYFSFSGSYYITVLDDYTPCRTNSSTYYQCMIQGDGHNRSYSSLTNLVNLYNNSSYNNTNYYYYWYYGRFDRDLKKWIFPIYYGDYTYYTKWSIIFGKMIPDETSGKFDYEFDFSGLTKSYEVRTAPKSSTVTTTETKKLSVDEYGQEALKQICLGTYWEWLESQESK